MNELELLKKRKDRFQNSLLSSIEYFRKGEDHSGLDDFINSVDDLEILLEYPPDSIEIKEKAEELISVFRSIKFCMKNHDVAGMTDTLELTLYPLIKEWFKGSDEN